MSKDSTYHNRMNTAPQRYTVHELVYCTARQCGQNVVNHTLHHSTLYHYYKLYLVYPAWHLNFARCTIYIVVTCPLAAYGGSIIKPLTLSQIRQYWRLQYRQLLPWRYCIIAMAYYCCLVALFPVDWYPLNIQKYSLACQTLLPKRGRKGLM